MKGKGKQRAAAMLTAMVRAVAALERKRVEVLDAELGELIRRGEATFERMRSGHTPITDPTEVRLLAEVAIQRGLFGGAWLREFLAVTGYPHPEALIAELGSTGLPTAPPPLLRAPWYDNLGPAPFGGAFIPRRELLAELLEALHQARIVVLLGIGGMGKSSLAYHLATLCQAQRGGAAGADTLLPGALPAVHAVVWVSDAARPGATTHAQLIDTILRTLDHPGATTDPLAAKAARASALLADIPTLIIVDNAETIRDPQVLPWLLGLPARSRALITTRQVVELYQDERVKILPLAGLTEAESRKLIREQAKYLGMGNLDPEAQQTLILRSGACPQAIKQLLGYAKRAQQPLGAVIAQFDALAGDLLADLFAHFWAEVLTEEARRLLIALTWFHAPVTREPLLHVTGFSPRVLDKAITQLSDAALIETSESPADPGAPRFALHPLTRAFASQRVEAPTVRSNVAARLITWAADYAGAFGYRLSDVGVLARLDADETTLRQALRDAAARGLHHEVIRLAKGLEFFYYVKCRWDDKLALHEHYIAAASASGDSGEQIKALTMHIQLLCRLNRPAQAQTILHRLEPLEPTAAGEERFHVFHARALSHHTRREPAQAQAQWATIVEQAEEWGLPGHMAIGALHWLGLSLLQTRNPARARQFFERSLGLARTPEIRRWVARNQLQLALLDIDANQLAQARRRLDESTAMLEEADREQRAHLRRVEARLLLARNEQREALTAYREARDLFARMGLLHELVEDDRIFGITG